jgi:biotin carboxylase
LLIGLDLKAGAACMRYAKKRGLSVVLADTAQNLALIPELVAQAEDTLEFDFKNVAEALTVVERYHAEKPLDGVFTYREFAVLTVAHIAAALGLPGNSPAAIERIRNKHLTRAALREAGHPQPASTLCHSLEDALAVFGAVSRDAWIVKPPAAFGSIGVSLVHSEEALAAAVARLHAIGEPSFLLEEFIEGREYSVEGLIDNGRAFTLAVTEKQTTGAPGFVETGHVIPAPIAPEVRARIAEEVAAALDVLGLRLGNFHVEVFVSGDRVVIGEVHNRQGGDFIDVLLEQALEIEFNGLGLDQLLGNELHLERIQPKRVAAIQFLCPPEGVVRKIEGLDALREHPQVVQVNITLEAGAVIPKTESSFSRSGSFIVTADTYEGVQALIRDLLDRLKIEIE